MALYRQIGSLRGNLRTILRQSLHLIQPQQLLIFCQNIQEQKIIHLRQIGPKDIRSVLVHRWFNRSPISLHVRPQRLHQLLPLGLHLL